MTQKEYGRLLNKVATIQNFNKSSIDLLRRVLDIGVACQRHSACKTVALLFGKNQKKEQYSNLMDTRVGAGVSIGQEPVDRFN